eukprot:m.35807 g.35807  ORF g.35807 m.35807 type:complete len:71 (-) comp8959_c0_seq2:198-410(-)
MASINPECEPLKEAYDKCFNNWYKQRFLKGETKDECRELLGTYRKCVLKHMEQKKFTEKDFEIEIPENIK